MNDQQLSNRSESGMVVRQIHLPRPTAWPIILAVGLGLLFASLVTNYGMAIMGLILIAASSIGWFREVLPLDREQHVRVTAPAVSSVIYPEASPVAHINYDATHRAQLPLETYRISSGLKGGVAGGIAMIIPAEAYGILRYHSPWYVVNLLGGVGAAGWANPSLAELTKFNLGAFITANIIQGMCTLLVGLLYGALLPIWPKRPMLLGGLVAPVLWTGIIHSLLGVVNPYLNDRIDWWSFAVAQVFFGVVAGYVVSRVGHIKRLAQIPLSIRLGLEAPGIMPERKESQE